MGEDFPDRAPSVLRAGDGFTQVSGRFVASRGARGVGPRGSWLDRLGVELPAEGSDAILLHGQKGFEARVYEVGAAGPAQLVDHAITYAREEGASVWTTTAGGVEEWIHVPAGRASADHPTAVWKIQGASLRQRGDAIELADADGAVRARMKAPAAFAASGKRVPVRLGEGAPAPDGSPTIELYVDGGDEAVLVDPVWQGAASLNTQRYEHAAAHLTNDQVLVAGGSDGFSTAIDSAELYTPSIDQWTETALMNEARICATSTGINDMDGTAVVVGGLNDFQNILGTAEDYDPTQDVWNELPEMNWTRMNHAATLLNDGRVLITGGIGAQNFEPDRFGGRARRPQGAKAVHTPGNPYAGASTDIFGSGGPGVTCWTFHPGGGSGSGGPGSLSSVEIWDPFTNGGQWEETNWMSYSRDRHTATLLSDGTVLAAGGYDTDFGSALSTGEVYDPVQQSWQIVPGSMSSAREDFTATLLMDGTGTVVLAGGTDGFNGPLSSVDFYIPGVGGGSGGGSGGSGGSGNLGFFMPAPPLNVARMQHVASILPNGQVLVAGGTDGVSSLGSAEVYDPVQQTWTLVDSMLYPATAPTATALQSGYVLVAGGADLSQNPPEIPDAELYLWAFPLGWACAAPTDCQSGFCADGVCCNTSCTEPCFQCSSGPQPSDPVRAAKARRQITGTMSCGGVALAKKPRGTLGGSIPAWTTNSDGCCMPAADGAPDPHGICATSDVSTCGLSGLCDGLGDCADYVQGTTCAPTVCSMNTLVDANFCDGNGTCVVTGSTVCDPGLCSLADGEGPSCVYSCATDTDCASDGYCDPSSTNCLPKQPNGQPAAGTDACTSGFVADGVCCDTACTGICVACTGAAKGSGSDGVCGPVQLGTNPHNDCTDQGSASCGTNGSCDGKGACSFYNAGTVCAAGSCAGDTVVQPSLCDGNGACVPGGTQSCAPAPCAAGTCASMCTTDSDCVATGYCAPSGTCAPKQPNGQPSTGTDQCLSGFFADGVCCNTACTGLCVACTAAKKGAGIDGACGPVHVGTDPDNECTDQGAASCSTNGSCDGNGACQLYAATTVCAPASCQGNTLVPASQCDGMGNCVAPADVSCAPGNCGGGICQLVCAVDADCKVTTAYCGNGMCQPKKPMGQPAGGSDECLTGFVADGVCCDQACAGGVCDACSVAAGATADGTCTSLTGACDDNNPCTLDDMCQNGVCVGTSAVDCPPAEACHENGVCDMSGACSYAPQPDGTACDDNNSCANATCQKGLCVSVNKLDGAPCTGGVCIAGTCVLDPTVATTSSTTTTTSSSSTTTGTGGAGTTTSSTTGTTGGGAGGAPDKIAPQLTGGGCLAVTPAEVPSGGGVAAFFAALALGLGRVVGRRRGGARRRA